MASGPYSFIDVAVIEEVRCRFAAGDALAILSPDLERVIWANGPGAQLLGFADIEACMGAESGLGFAARRQISAVRGFPRPGRDHPVTVRLASGIMGRAVPMLVSGVDLPDAAPAVLLAVPAAQVGARDAATIATRAVGGLSREAGYFGAILGAGGEISAASAGFADLGIAPATLSELVEEVRSEGDRLVKRMIPAQGRLLPAGIARLTDDPAVHLLIAVDEAFDVPEETSASGAAVGEEAASAAIPAVEETAVEAEPPAAVDTTDAPEVEAGAALPATDPALVPTPLLPVLATAEIVDDIAPASDDTPDGETDEVSVSTQAGAPDKEPAASAVSYPVAQADLALPAFPTEDGPQDLVAMLDAHGQSHAPPLADEVEGSGAEPAAPAAPEADLHDAEPAAPILEGEAAVPSLAEAEPEESGTAEPSIAAAPDEPPAAEDSASPEAGTGADGPAGEAPAASGRQPAPGAGPIRFVWRTDSEDRFSVLSDEFVDAVGPNAGRVLGLGFREVATRFGLDPDGDIASLLERRDTWSGRSVLWPIEGTDLRVPVDLAALPVYSRDRRFEGFRGFGVARLADVVVDPEETGLRLVPDAGPGDEAASPEAVRGSETGEIADEPPHGLPAIGAPGALPASDRVVQLSDHRAAESRLSNGERNAFREIGARLRRDVAVPDDGSETPDAAAPIIEPEAPVSASTDEAPRIVTHDGDEVASPSDQDDESTPETDTDAVVAASPVAEGASPEISPDGEPADVEAELGPDHGEPTGKDAGIVPLPDEAEDAILRQSEDTGEDRRPSPDTFEPTTGATEDTDRAGEPDHDAAVVADVDTGTVDNASTVLGATALGDDAGAAASEALPTDAGGDRDAQGDAPAADDDRRPSEAAAASDGIAVPPSHDNHDASTEDETPALPDTGSAEAAGIEGETQRVGDDPPDSDGVPAEPIDVARDATPGAVLSGPLAAAGDDAPGYAEEDGTEDGREAGDDFEPRGADEPAAEDQPNHGAVAEADGHDDNARQVRQDDDVPAEPTTAEGEPAPDEAGAVPAADVAAGASATEGPAMPAAPLAPFRPAPPIATSGFVPSAWSMPGGLPEIAELRLLAPLPLPVLVHAGDRLIHANPAFFALTGYRDLDELDERGGLGALFAGPAREGRLELRRSDGETFPVDAHLQSVGWNGGKALMLSLARATLPPSEDPEIEPLRRRVEEMRTIIDTATDGVVLIAPDGGVRSISRPAEALFGLDSAAVEGKPFASLFAIESQRSARDYLSGLSENGVASVLNDGREVIGREAEGRFIPLFMTIGRLPGGGYCAVLRDITQWKRAEEDLTQARAQAERASSQKTEFLARVSHEIRTPLNAIIGFSELMVDEKFGPIGSDRYRDYLRDINRSGSHVLDLVNDLLDISKIEAGEQEMHYEAVSLNDALAETVAMMQPQANRERVIIRSSLASRLPNVVADLRSIRQIALNLLSNALRYTQAGGQVIVSTSYEPSGDVTMRVRDTGIGMTLSEIDQALKPFKQINALKRGRTDGTGLGLPLTKAMVEANRARFTITSAPGEGTLVEVVFPSTRVLAN